MSTIGNASAEGSCLVRGLGRGLRRGLRRAANFIRNASNRRMLRAPTMSRRGGAAGGGRAASGTALLLDIMWNLAFVMVAAGVLVMSVDELPATPLRVWVLGYIIHCTAHVVSLYLEYIGRGGRASSDFDSSRDHDENGGASEEDISRLPKYKFHRMEGVAGLAHQLPGPFGGIMSKCDSDTPIEHVLSAKDSDCCICITPYDDGVELRELPCSHHFHRGCVDKWLTISATCPLCKFKIMKSSDDGMEEV